MGVTLAAGGSFGWWADVLGEAAGELDFDRLADLAGEAPAGSEGLLFLPYLFGERTPHLDPFARGAFFGLTARHGLRHLTRAVMEGVVLSLRDCLDLMVAQGVEVSDLRVTGGGSRHPLWRQLQADAYDKPARRPVVDQGPAYGAALLAGVAGGVFADVDAATRVVTVEPEVVTPQESTRALYEASLAVFRSLYPATRDAMHRLGEVHGA
jgi:xylulokinase